MTERPVPKLRVYDHFDGKKKDFQPLDPARVTMYVCGMTVQGPPHMGHMLAFVAADLVRRTLEFLGYEVLHVQNFTDIDDKIIAQAAEMGHDAGRAGPAEHRQLLRGGRRPAHPAGPRSIRGSPSTSPRSWTTSAGSIETGHAYEAGGSVWFDVRSWNGYGG